MLRARFGVVFMGLRVDLIRCLAKAYADCWILSVLFCSAGG